MKPIFLCLTLLLAGCKLVGSTETDAKPLVSPGPRPLYLMQALPDGDLKQRLQACKTQPFYRHDFSIGHRGAPLMFAEHSKQSYQAAIDMGAGIVECLSLIHI